MIRNIVSSKTMLREHMHARKKWKKNEVHLEKRKRKHRYICVHDSIGLNIFPQTSYHTSRHYKLKLELKRGRNEET